MSRSMGKPTRNSEVLASFVAYCAAHQSQRFWQALLNWSGLPFIFVSDAPTYDLKNPSHDGIDAATIVDPYYWEGRNS